jgi:hypothetical protein
VTADHPCPLDGAALPADRFVCRGCTGRLRGLLTDLPGLMGDLDVALAKQARFSGNVGGRSTTTALAFGYAASEAAWVARQTILVWIDWVTAVRGHRVPDTWGEVGDYLARLALDWIARHPNGPQCVDELTAAIRQARHCIDRPAERRYVGVCNGTTLDADGLAVICTQELYALGDHDTVECPRCGATYDVRARQDAMLNQIRDHVLTAADMARAVDGLGVDITFDRIRQWKRRGQLAPVLDEAGNPRADIHGRPLYRVGDVLDIVAGRVGCTVVSA